MSVQQEVTRALARPEDFLDVPTDAPDYRRKSGGMVRDTFARRFAEVLAERSSR